MQPRSTAKPYQAIFDVTYLYWLSQGIYTVTKLNIASLLKTSSLNASRLCEVLSIEYPHIDSDNLYRVMRNLSAIGVFAVDANDHFRLTTIGEALLDENTRAIILDVCERRWITIANLDTVYTTEQFNAVFHQHYSGLPQKLSDIFFAFRYSKALYLFIKSGLVDTISASAIPMSITEMAAKSGIEETIVNTLCALMYEKGITESNDNVRYSLSEVGMTLLKDHPRSLRNVPLHENIAKWQAASNLLAAVTEGKEPFQLTHGQGLFDYLKQLENADKQEFEIFNHAMAEISRVEIDAISQNLLIPTTTKTIMDVGGGTGALMHAILGEHANVQGIIFDLPETVQHLSELGSCCKAVGGSFFDQDTMPDADLILLKRALHDWSNDKAAEILRNCAEKCHDICVIEWLWKNTAFVASLDLFLMSIGGKIRSEQDFRRLLDSANIPCTSITELTAGVFAVTGTPKQLKASTPLSASQSGIFSSMTEESKAMESKPGQSPSALLIKNYRK